MGTDQRPRKKEEAAAQKKREEREDLEQFRQNELTKDLQTLMKMREFRNVMTEILGMAGIFQTAMTGNSHTFHIIGKQDYGKEILTFLARAGQEEAFNLLIRQQVKAEK